MLTKKDIVYRVERADIKAVVCALDEYVLGEVDAAYKDCSSILKHRIVLDTDREGWINFDAETQGSLR
jgi:acetyl-CoA synthetase